MARLQDKIAVVTGIGEATCRRFVEEGAHVAIFEVNEETGAATARALRDTGADVIALGVNVTDEASVQAGVDQVLNRWGRIDILVNNAGIPGANKYTHELSVAEWDAVFAVNAKGVFLCSKFVLPGMMERRAGAIVNFSSIYGLIGNNDLPAYHATKGAVMLMTKTDAVCYAPYGIRVNCVHPGSVKTPLFMKAAETYPGGLQVYLDTMKAKHPLTLGEPVDVANCVLFLASDEARFVTGASLVCDGGYTAQ